MKRQDGQKVTYNPERLHGIAAYREISREFSAGDRLQFHREQAGYGREEPGFGNHRTDRRPSYDRSYGWREGPNSDVRCIADAALRPRLCCHVAQLSGDSPRTGCSSTWTPQLTRKLINTRFAYVSVSRASQDARVYTNDVSTLAERLSADISKASAVEVSGPNSEADNQQCQPKERTMTNTKEHSPEEQGQPLQHEAHKPADDKGQIQAEVNLRHYAPIQSALANEATGYDWKRETGDIQSLPAHPKPTGGYILTHEVSSMTDRRSPLLASRPWNMRIIRQSSPGTTMLKLRPSPTVSVATPQGSASESLDCHAAIRQSL